MERYVVKKRLDAALNVKARFIAELDAEGRAILDEMVS